MIVPVESATTPTEYLAAGDRAFAAGDWRKGSAHWWQAAWEAVGEAAEQQGWPGEDEVQIYDFLRHLDKKRNGAGSDLECRLLLQFMVAGILRHHAAGDVRLKKRALRSYRSTVAELVDDMRAVAGGECEG